MENNKRIHNNFKFDISKKEHPFVVPNAYFEKLSNTIAANTIDKHQKFVLEQAESKNIFITPAHYFDNLPRLIQAKLTQNIETGWLVGQLFSVRNVLTSIALIILTIGAYNFIDNTSTLMNNQSLSGISDKAVIEYLDNEAHFSPAKSVEVELYTYKNLHAKALDKMTYDLDVDVEKMKDFIAPHDELSDF